MANYDPPQSLLKRVAVGSLDLIASFEILGLLISKVIGSRPNPPSADDEGVITFRGSASGIGFDIEGWPALLLIALVIAYLVILGRSGGTIFQRLFGMKRCEQSLAIPVAKYDPPEPLWKRVTAAVYDFLLVSIALGILIENTIGSRPGEVALGAATGASPPAGQWHFKIDLEGWPQWLWWALIVAYFVILNRTGGTVFQRLFGMKRA